MGPDSRQLGGFPGLAPGAGDITETEEEKHMGQDLEEVKTYTPSILLEETTCK